MRLLCECGNIMHDEEINTCHWFTYFLEEDYKNFLESSSKTVEEFLDNLPTYNGGFVQCMKCKRIWFPLAEDFEIYIFKNQIVKKENTYNHHIGINRRYIYFWREEYYNLLNTNPKTVNDLIKNMPFFNNNFIQCVEEKKIIFIKENYLIEYCFEKKIPREYNENSFLNIQKLKSRGISKI